jgi:hypothetical protein
MALVGLVVDRYTPRLLAGHDRAQPRDRHRRRAALLPNGLPCQGKCDFEAILPFWEEDEFFAAALGVQNVPSPETLRHVILPLMKLGRDILR